MSLIVKRSFGAPAEVRFCSSCNTSHIGRVPCGMTWAERVGSVQIHGEATPTKSKKQYWDDEGLKEVFGQDKRERKEQMLDETDGRGPVYAGQKMSPEEAKFYFGDDD